MAGVTPSTTLRARLFVLGQHLLPQHFLSRLVLRLTRSRARPLKRALIGAFVRHFRPDMRDAVTVEPQRYPTFNAFFTRALRPDARPSEPDPLAVASPVDGAVSQIGRLVGARIVQAKGHVYTVEALLAGASEWSRRFVDGSFATLYLAPYNYHRIHMPLEGELRAAWFVPGRLYSVNAATAAAVPGLFARNERVVLLFENGPLAWALVMVGALFVGSMSTVWHGDVTPRRARRAVELPIVAERAPLRLAKGAELGRFNMGSTVVLLLPPQAAEWRTDINPGRGIRVGETLGRLVPRKDRGSGDERPVG